MTFSEVSGDALFLGFSLLGFFTALTGAVATGLGVSDVWVYIGMVPFTLHLVTSIGIGILSSDPDDPEPRPAADGGDRRADA